MPRARYVPGNDPLPGPTAGAVTLRRDVTECICDVKRVRTTPGVGAISSRWNILRIRSSRSTSFVLLSCSSLSLVYHLSVCFLLFPLSRRERTHRTLDAVPASSCPVLVFLYVTDFIIHPSESLTTWWVHTLSWVHRRRRLFDGQIFHNDRTDLFSASVSPVSSRDTGKPLMRLTPSRLKGSAGPRALIGNKRTEGPKYPK